MKVNNKILIATIALGFIVIAFNIIFENEEMNSWGSLAEIVTEYAGLYLLYKNGTFQNSRLSRFTGLSIAMVLIGSMFKIMHWPGVAQLFGLAIISFVVLYTVHFSSKHPKQALDWGKLLILILVCSARWFRFFHWKNAYELQYISTFVFLSFILYYIIISLKSGDLSLNN
ncbi:MAG: hypothetical protein J7604_08500 [Sporocytophaga sp.]|uniref:GldL-related protein n=1 Tax=Sporocytophaga sp. TaxID=2231183 RepID=UPI001B0209D4|nr:hypothetical protein [Sporocytophaga sp.]MBO9700236.1 hypothetical protein [Sporocytophaga sp.]